MNGRYIGIGLKKAISVDLWFQQLAQKKFFAFVLWQAASAFLL